MNTLFNDFNLKYFKIQISIHVSYCSQQTFTERQYELGQRTGSKSLLPVIVPMYLAKTLPNHRGVSCGCIAFNIKVEISKAA